MHACEASYLGDALERAGDGALAIKNDGCIVLWNRMAERILGYTARETLGRQCCEVLIGCDDRGDRLCYKGCHVMTLVKTGDRVPSFDMQTQTKAGQLLWLNVSTIVTSNGSGGPLTIHLFRDGTAIKAALNVTSERWRALPLSPRERDGLTRREMEILRLVAIGENTKGMAARLSVSPSTVRNHVQNILGKLGVHSRLQAVAHATTHRLL